MGGKSCKIFKEKTIMIKFLDLQKINLNYQQEIEDALLQTFRSGWYLLGEKPKLLRRI
jgi:hypothetical protein